MGENPTVAKAFLHMWEEPCISGTRGSGTVFFSGCNLKCIFCQNHEISHGGTGKEITAGELATIFLSLKSKGAHNINLVTPSHYIPAIKEALEIARIDIPVIYNTNAYDSLEGLKMLEGLVDIYLPDLKYISPEVSAEYSGASNYFDVASKAVLEMYRQTGKPVYDEAGMLKKGVVIRHLVLPGHIRETIKILEWIAENLSDNVVVSLMSQYLPCYKACGHPVLGRRITRYEYEKALRKFEKLGLNGYVQDRESASDEYIPDFK